MFAKDWIWLGTRLVSRRLRLGLSIARAIQSSSPELLHGQNAVTDSDRSPLKDTFGRFHNYLRISLVEKCNLRCVYCMPAGGVPLSPRDELLSFDERLRVLRIFSRLGVNKV